MESGAGHQTVGDCSVAGGGDSVGVGCLGDPAEDGIRDSVASRGLGDVYKRQPYVRPSPAPQNHWAKKAAIIGARARNRNRNTIRDIPDGLNPTLSGIDMSIQASRVR